MGTRNTKSNAGQSSKAPVKTDAEIQAEKLAAAKVTLDAARKRKVEASTKIRKHTRTLKDGPERVVKLKKQLVQAKAGTTKSAEDMIKKARELDAETKKLDTEAKGLEKQASGLYREQEDLRIEIGSVKEANATARGTNSGSGSAPKGTGMSSSKSSLIKALARRQYVVQYGPGETPAAVGAQSQKDGKNDGKIALVLGKEDFTMSVQGAKPTTHSYGAGAIMTVERANREIPEDEKSGKAAANTGS